MAVVCLKRCELTAQRHSLDRRQKMPVIDIDPFLAGIYRDDVNPFLFHSITSSIDIDYPFPLTSDFS